MVTASVRLLVWLGVAGFLFAAEGARADMLVLESTEPTIQAGQTIKGNEIAAKNFIPGSHVRVLMLETQTTVDFARPPEKPGIPGGVRGLTRKPPAQ